MRVCRVSSHAIQSASFNTRTARNVMSSRFPMGEATRYKTPGMRSLDGEPDRLLDIFRVLTASEDHQAESPRLGACRNFEFDRGGCLLGYFHLEVILPVGKEK